MGSVVSSPQLYGLFSFGAPNFVRHSKIQNLSPPPHHPHQPDVRKRRALARNRFPIASTRGIPVFLALSPSLGASPNVDRIVYTNHMYTISIHLPNRLTYIRIHFSLSIHQTCRKYSHHNPPSPFHSHTQLCCAKDKLCRT